MQLFIGKDANGKRQYKSFTAPTKKGAEYLAAQYNIDRKEQQKCELTFENAAERYIESKRNVLSPSTVRGYYAVLRNYCGKLNAIKISDINQEIIQIVINDIAAVHSPKTCRNVHGFISAVLSVFSPNMPIHTTLPQKQKREIYVPDESEIREIRVLLIGKPMEIPFLLAAECGLRASEISALNVRNVFPDHIEIKEARVIGTDGEAVKSPKSAAGYRSIPINGDMYEMLKNAADESGRVCRKRAPDISNSWSNFKSAHNLDENFNFHALRHHYASKCLLLGIPQKYIAELMGHSSTDMIERVYQHIFPSAMEQYANILREQMKNVCNTKSNT